METKWTKTQVVLSVLGGLGIAIAAIVIQWSVNCFITDVIQTIEGM